MALINCKECGFKVSDKAATCVHCGAPVAAAVAPAPAPAPAPASAPKKKPKSWLVPVIVALVVLVIFGFMNAFPEQFDSITGRASPNPTPFASAPSPAAVNALNLFKDYKTNEALADISYKGKSLVVSGVVDTFNKNSEAPFVALSGGGPAKAVYAYFPRSALDKLSALKRGQKITITCMGGGMLNGSPILKACMMSGL